MESRDYYKEPAHFAGTIRTKMPRLQRAKQFMPFAAVTGLEKALEGKRRLHEEKMKAEEGYEHGCDDEEFDEE